MPFLLKSVTGLFTGVALGAVSLAYWPQVQPATSRRDPSSSNPAGRAIGAGRTREIGARQLALALRDAQPNAAPARTGRRAAWR